MLRIFKGLFAILLALPVLSASGCTDHFGKVDQGRVIAFDREKKTVTIIRDSSTDPKNPEYNSLPPVTYSLPADPNEMGPEPKAGKRMKLDAGNRQLVVFVPDMANFVKIDYTLIDQKENVGDKDPLVWDQAGGKARKFPLVDRNKKIITIYSKRQKTVTSFSVPEKYLAFSEDTWDNGDEVRIYYKEEGKAKRFMNISKTNIFKK